MRGFCFEYIAQSPTEFSKIPKNNRRPLCFNVEMLCISVRCCRSSIPPKNVSPAHFLRRAAVPTAAAMSEFLKIYKHSKAVLLLAIRYVATGVSGCSPTSFWLLL